MLVQRLARDAGLDHAVEILGVDFQHLVHVAKVDANAAGRRVDLALQRGAGAERDHGNAVAGANPHHVLNVGGLLRHHHRIGRLRFQPGRGMGVLLAHRLRGDQPVAEPRGERFHGAAASAFGSGALQIVGDRCSQTISSRQKYRGKGYIGGQGTEFANGTGWTDDDILPATMRCSGPRRSCRR